MTGESFADWKGYRDGGSFESRRSNGASAPAGDGAGSEDRGVVTPG